jgi:hypothetical protein
MHNRLPQRFYFFEIRSIFPAFDTFYLANAAVTGDFACEWMRSGRFASQIAGRLHCYRAEPEGNVVDRVPVTDCYDCSR